MEHTDCRYCEAGFSEAHAPERTGDDPGTMHIDDTQTELVAPAGEWARCLSNALLLTSKKTERPLLCSIHIVKRGDELTFEATDSYGAIRQTMAINGDEVPAIDVLLHKDDVAQIVKLYRALPAMADAAVRFTSTEVTIQAGQLLRFSLVVGTFPDLDAIWPAWAGSGVSTIGINLDLVALLAKIVPAGGHAKNKWTKRNESAGRFAFGDTDLKPFTVEIPNSGATVALMPTRMA